MYNDKLTISVMDGFEINGILDQWSRIANVGAGLSDVPGYYGTHANNHVISDFDCIAYRRICSHKYMPAYQDIPTDINAGWSSKKISDRAVMTNGCARIDQGKWTNADINTQESAGEYNCTLTNGGKGS